MTQCAIPGGTDIPGSWSFSLRTPSGRVLACVSNKVLLTYFGPRDPEDLFSTFASHIELLHEAALVRLRGGYTPAVEIQAYDIAAAMRRND